MTYAPQTHTTMIGDNEITVNSLTPIFSTDEEQKRVKQAIQDRLFNIFDKYINA